jgi:hypothetical protein
VTLSLAETQAVTKLADVLYSFLPSTPHPYGNKLLSFPGVAAEVGIGQHWIGGSKHPAIVRLLNAALERERGRFCPLIIAIVRSGMVYRKDNPITREEIDEINSIIARLGNKIPDLHAPTFLNSLPRVSARGHSSKSTADEKVLGDIKQKFVTLQSMEPARRGYAFEGFLSELFALFQLAPRGFFRLTGEQINGSFRLHAEVYLLEARWRNEASANADLLAFSGKVDGKAQWSRGLFVSYAGFTSDGLLAFARGRRTNLIGIDGLDLWLVLNGKLDLIEVLDRKARRAAETNETFVSVRDLFQTIS